MIELLSKDLQSSVERVVLEKNGDAAQYAPTEKIKTVVVENFPELGKIAALRFLEWAQQNPGATLALPTGKTPEHFIKWVSFLLNNWGTDRAIPILEAHAIDPANRPDMSQFYFVQIDEFYPINSWQHNSFYHYVNKYYIKGFGLDPRKALLINPNQIGLRQGEKLESVWPGQKVDLSLRTRLPRTALEERQKKLLGDIDQWCTEYELRIRQLGGIGFFLGGIGPDGHIGFNVQGSDHFSTTRLTETNYETQAAAAGDLGGIEISRNRLVITIGLQTIAYSADTTAIIIAAGEAKAAIVREAIQAERSNEVPATILHGLENAAFYLTRGAAKLLVERTYHRLARETEINSADQRTIITNVALQKSRSLAALRLSDLKTDRLGRLLVDRAGKEVLQSAREIALDYEALIQRGLSVHKNEVFLHTAPHHDDIMLAYLPYLVRLMREQSNVHHFNYLTSGFNAVTNRFMLEQVRNAKAFLKNSRLQALLAENYFDPDNHVFRDRDVWQYLDGLAAGRSDELIQGAARRFIRNVVAIYSENSLEEFEIRIGILETYFETQYPGKKDTQDIQRLKGMVREWEADVLWGYFGFNTESVIHSRLGFYKGDLFTEEPELNRDVLPVLQTLKRVNPTVVTVALDPEGSGPDTHYKVLQTISTALRLYQKETGRSDITVWGYRNVWYRYSPAEANMFVPVTFNGMAICENAFLNCFVSQAEASFPSYEYDGPFSGLAKKIQVEQYRFMNTLLGRDFFYRNPDSRIRSARGFLYLQEMDLDTFFDKSRELRKSTENL